MSDAPNDTKRHYRAVTAGVTGALTASAVAVWLARTAFGTLADARAAVPVTPEAALTGTLAALGALGLVWLVLGVVLEALALVPGAVGRAAARASAALSPVVVRRVAALVLGAGIGSGAVGVAHAGPAHPVVTVAAGVAHSAAAPSPSADLPDPSWAPGPDPGWTPEPPTVRPQPDVRVLTGAARAAERAGEVVVHRGDSLWSIAARHLGEGASDAEVAAAWPRWYEANRDVVGPDPDVLHPGQVLRSPDAVDALDDAAPRVTS